jgi:hypothetical protein
MGIFTVKMTRWLSKNVPGKTYNEITLLFNNRFNAEFTPSQIKERCINFGIKTGYKGHRKEHKVGTERIIDKKSGVTYIKTSNKPTKGCGKIGLTGTWRQKHSVIWEAANGKIPKGHIIIFADRNKTNFDIENLLPVSKREFFYMARYGLLTGSAELTRTNHAIAKHVLAIADAVRRLTGGKTHYAVKDEYRMFLLRNNPRRLSQEGRHHETP